MRLLPPRKRKDHNRDG